MHSNWILGLSLYCMVAGSWAQSYPDRPIRMIVAYPAGGGADFFARLIAKQLSNIFKQQVIVDNRAGGGANIGAEAAARSTPDGYTVFLATIAYAVNPTFIEKLSYDPQKDLVGVSQTASLSNVLVAHPSVPIGNVREFIALLKKRPGQVQYGSAGSGSSTHLAAELFKHLAAVDMLHVPYRGAADSSIALLGGQVHVMFASLPTALPHVRTGRLKALGVTGNFRTRSAPDLPTVSESGLPQYEMSSWQGIMVRAGTPDTRIAILNNAIDQVLRTQEVIDMYAREGGDPIGSSPDQFSALVGAEIQRWGKILRQTAIKAD